MFLTSAIALLIQPDMNLLAYEKPNTSPKISKIELTIPEINPKDLKQIKQKEERKRNKSNNKKQKKFVSKKQTSSENVEKEIKFLKPNFNKSIEEKNAKYEYEVRKKELLERYEKSLLPKSGYMTKAQYEMESRVKDKAKEELDFKDEILTDKDMIYLPQPTYKLVRYNSPPGSPEIHLSRKYKFDRQENNYGLISNDIKTMVYPVVYYYADRNVTTCDVFVIPLDTSLPDTKRILKANVARRWQKPILSTEKDTEVRNTFRTMTPIDFNVSHNKLVAKEKIGNTFDGIWQTKIWIYDFETRKAKELSEIRQAILHYWKKEKGVELSEYRWDIYPLGFDVNNDERILVNAYAYTGDKPRFLGTWSIDYNGESSKLENIESKNQAVSVVGFKLIQSGIKSPEIVKAETKNLEDISKLKTKEEKEAKKKEKKEKKFIYKEQLKQLKQNYYKKVCNIRKIKAKKNYPTS